MNMQPVSASVKKVEDEAKSVTYIRNQKDINEWTDIDFIYESIYKALHEDYIIYRSFHYFNKEFPLSSIVYKKILKSYIKEMISRNNNIPNQEQFDI